MSNANIVKFPSCPTWGGQRIVLILCAVSKKQEECISCEYKQNLNGWVFDLRAPTIDGLIAALIQCKDTIFQSERSGT